MCGEWILFVGGTHFHEMIVGAVSVAASGAFLYSVQRTNTSHLRFTAADVLTCWRIPWYIISDIYVITAVMFKDILGVKRAGSFYRVGAFIADKTDPLLAARRVLATAYTTAAPNSIIIGIDYGEDRILFHQLERSTIPKMTQALGASSYPSHSAGTSGRSNGAGA